MDGEAPEITELRRRIRELIVARWPLAVRARWDRDDRVPRAELDALRELDVFGLCVPEEYGGQGRKVVAFAAVMEELARAGFGLAGLYQMCAGYVGLNVATSGSDEQRQRFLPDVVAGKVLFAYGLSEPEVGADLATVRTTARRDGDAVVIEGAKRWTSAADMVDHILVLARSGDPAARRENLSLVIVPVDTPGITMRQQRTMGGRGIPPFDVTFDGVRVPATNVLGGDDGWNRAWQMLVGPALEVEKLSPCAVALGLAEAAVAEAWAYSQVREQGGKRICGHQSVRHVLVDAQTRLQACRLMMRDAVEKVQRGEPSATATSMAKLFITETAKQIVLDCQQSVMGAYGYGQASYGEGYEMERLVRDVLATPIYGGSSAIQRNNIANLMGLPRE
jgi:alkylation response protein AidB-like acyl-CoA dehydrogenase